jgi:hypothetical protein
MFVKKTSMKTYRIFLTAILLVFSIGFSSQAQDCSYYPVKKGAVLGYKTIDDKGKVTSTSRTTILDIFHEEGAAVYKVKSEFWDNKNKEQPLREYSMKCKDGVFSIDMQSMLDPKSLEGFKDMEVTFTGTDIVFPNDLVVNQTLPDANVTIGAASGGFSLMKMTINITNRKVEGVESVTVPAGTFACFKITYDIETKMGIKIASKAVLWMNKGVGSVKSETYDQKGKLQASTVLNEVNL